MGAAQGIARDEKSQTRPRAAPDLSSARRPIEAHIFVAFLAYCVHVTLRQRLRVKAPGLTPRAVLGKFAAVHLLDAWFPTTDDRWLVFHRVTQPERDVHLLLVQLGLQLPPQSPLRITADGHLAAPARPSM